MVGCNHQQRNWMLIVRQLAHSSFPVGVLQCASGRTVKTQLDDYLHIDAVFCVIHYEETVVFLGA